MRRSKRQVFATCCCLYITGGHSIKEEDNEGVCETGEKKRTKGYCTKGERKDHKEERCVVGGQRNTGRVKTGGPSRGLQIDREKEENGSRETLFTKKGSGTSEGVAKPRRKTDRRRDVNWRGGALGRNSNF